MDYSHAQGIRGSLEFLFKYTIMVRSCTAIGCQHRETKNRTDLLFKNLPCDERLKMIWLDKMR